MMDVPEWIHGILNSLDELIVIMDREGKPLYQNEQARGGRDELPEGSLGQSVSLCGEDRAFWKAKLDRLLARGRRQEFEREVVDRAGQRRVIRFTMVMLGDLQDGTPGIGVIGRDTTGFRSLQGELETCRREREAFVSTISHDLRTPIVSVQGFTNLLMRKYKDRMDEKGIQYLDRLKHEADRMERLLGDVVAAAETGRSGDAGT